MLQTQYGFPSGVRPRADSSMTISRMRFVSRYPNRMNQEGVCGVLPEPQPTIIS